MREKDLRDTIQHCFVDWEGDFSVRLEGDERCEGHSDYFVTIEHKFLGDAVSFLARVYENGYCEMDYADDNWHQITMGNLFAWLWFETAQPRSHS